MKVESYIDSTRTTFETPWNKQGDQLKVTFSQCQKEATKRGVLRYLASVYNSIGLIPPILVPGKMIFREIWNLKIDRDTELSYQLKLTRERW